MIQLEYKTTPADFQAFQKFAVSAVFGFTPKASFGRSLVIGIPAGILVAFVLILMEFEIHWPTVFVFGGLFTVFYVVARWRLARAFQPTEQGALVGHRRMSLDGEGVLEESEDHRHRSAWHGIVLVKETPDHVFLLVDRFAGYIVPKRRFADSQRVEEFVTFARAHSRKPQTS